LANGTREWWINGKNLTQEEFKQMQKDKPTEIYSNGNKYWRNDDGQFHRENGPAAEWANGNKFWWINGKCHREDGPAAEYANGDKSWWINGRRHREDGPAIERADGTKEWWIDGKKLTQGEFEQRNRSLVYHCDICEAFQKKCEL